MNKRAVLFLVLYMFRWENFAEAASVEFQTASSSSSEAGPVAHNLPAISQDNRVIANFEEVAEGQDKGMKVISISPQKTHQIFKMYDETQASGHVPSKEKTELANRELEKYAVMDMRPIFVKEEPPSSQKLLDGGKTLKTDPKEKFIVYDGSNGKIKLMFHGKSLKTRRVHKVKFGCYDRPLKKVLPTISNVWMDPHHKNILLIEKSISGASDASNDHVEYEIFW